MYVPQWSIVYWGSIIDSLALLASGYTEIPVEGPDCSRLDNLVIKSEWLPFNDGEGDSLAGISAYFVSVL
jgi:hypothetical protein